MRWKRWPGRRRRGRRAPRSSSLRRARRTQPVRAISSSRTIGSWPRRRAADQAAAARAPRRPRPAGRRSDAELLQPSCAVSTSLAPCGSGHGSPRTAASGWSRDGEHLAAGLDGQPRRDQRAGLQRGLDHQRAARQPGDDAVALRKFSASGGVPSGCSLSSSPSAACAPGQRAMAARVDAGRARWRPPRWCCPCCRARPRAPRRRCQASPTRW